jgi:hypothetical protein
MSLVQLAGQAKWWNGLSRLQILGFTHFLTLRAIDSITYGCHRQVISRYPDTERAASDGCTSMEMEQPAID